MSKSTPAPKAVAKSTSPQGTEAPQGNLRERLAKLSGCTSKIASLKRTLHKSFFEVGLILNQVRDERLYEVKGFGSFEAFLEREVDINKVLAMRISRVVETLTREAALEAGLERSAAAIAALDGEASGEQPLLRATGTLGPVLPLHKQ